VDEEPLPPMSREVYDADRAGFSCFFWEQIRYRVELVVVKSQSVSVLHRMERNSSSVDGPDSRNGAKMKRFAGLEKLISALTERLSRASEGSTEPGASRKMQASLNDIQVPLLRMSHSSCYSATRCGVVCRPIDRMGLGHGWSVEGEWCAMVLGATVGVFRPTVRPSTDYDSG